ncbi:hypothetical protein SPFM8_00238 [Salmonella phage SPFM8]|nr:hypothetical protein SPFM8_00238 [Salmonella phage SPFM8]
MKGNNRKNMLDRRNLSLVRRCCGAAATLQTIRELSMVLFSPDGDEDLFVGLLISEVIMNELNQPSGLRTDGTIKVLEQFQKATKDNAEYVNNDTAATNLNRYSALDKAVNNVGDERELLAVVVTLGKQGFTASAFLGRECLEHMRQAGTLSLVGHDDGVDFVPGKVLVNAQKGFEYATAPLVVIPENKVRGGQALAQLNTTMNFIISDVSRTTTHNGKQVNKAAHDTALIFAFKAMIDPSVAEGFKNQQGSFQQMSNVASELIGYFGSLQSWQALPKSAREAGVRIPNLLNTLLQHNVTYGIYPIEVGKKAFKGYTKKRQSSQQVIHDLLDAEEYLNDLSSALGRSPFTELDLENLNLAIAMADEVFTNMNLKISAVKDAYIEASKGLKGREKVGEKAESFSQTENTIIGQIISNGNGFAGNGEFDGEGYAAGKVGLVVLIMTAIIKIIGWSNYTRTHQKETIVALESWANVAVESSRPGTIPEAVRKILTLQIDAILDEVRRAGLSKDVAQLNLYMQRNEADLIYGSRLILGEIGEVLRSRMAERIDSVNERADFMSMEMTGNATHPKWRNRRSVD